MKVNNNTYMVGKQTRECDKDYTHLWEDYRSVNVK